MLVVMMHAKPKTMTIGDMRETEYWCATPVGKGGTVTCHCCWSLLYRCGDADESCRYHARVGVHSVSCTTHALSKTPRSCWWCGRRSAAGREAPGVTAARQSAGGEGVDCGGSTGGRAQGQGRAALRWGLEAARPTGKGKCERGGFGAVRMCGRGTAGSIGGPRGWGRGPVRCVWRIALMLRCIGSRGQARGLASGEHDRVRRTCRVWRAVGRTRAM